MISLWLWLACSAGKDSTTESAADELRWETVAEGLPSAVLSIAGSAADDVWAVGADNGSGPQVLHYDGSNWTPITTGSSGDIWWSIHLGEHVYMVGASGQITRCDGDGNACETSTLDDTLTFYGIWGSSETDLWAVGGRPELGANGGSIWHFDGTTWSLATIPAEAAAVLALYKVWGNAANDVWVCGANGIMLHWDGSAWNSVASGVSSNIFTVNGKDGGLFAVGGDASATIIRYDGSAWVNDPPGMASQLNGVAALGPDRAFAVGNQGAIWQRDANGWQEDTRKDPIYADLHTAWVDDAGGLWAGGGHLSSRPLDGGLIFYLGPDLPPSP